MIYIEVKLNLGYYKEFEERCRDFKEGIRKDSEGMSRKYVVLPLGDGCWLEVSGPGVKEPIRQTDGKRTANFRSPRII